MVEGAQAQAANNGGGGAAVFGAMFDAGGTIVSSVDPNAGQYVNDASAMTK